VTDLDYQAFLEAKVPLAQPVGFPCDLSEIPTHLVDGREMRPHIAPIVRWAVNMGRAALFEAFGLHKTMQQLLIVDIILRKQREAGEVAPCALIVCPLGVRAEFFNDARLLGMSVRFVKSDAEMVADDEGGIYLTNYESVRDGKLTVSRFRAVSLDEADVLRSYGSKTYQTFLPLFDDVPYRFVATATPNPNRHKELIHYAGFLGIMDTGQALTRFFQRNSEKSNDLTLYPHKQDEFWLWLNSWAVCLQTPSDLGFSDDGYILPPIDVRWHVVQVDIADAGTDARGQGKLLRDAAMGLQEAAREKRGSMAARVAKTAEIIAAAPNDHFLIWHDLEDERRALAAAIPESEFVYGSLPLDQREGIVERFKTGLLRNLGAKPVMLGAGGNLQAHCHREIFAGVGFKFRDFIQAIHRVQRFGQDKPVEIDIIYAETEQEVVRQLQEKWAQHDEMAARMSAIIRRYGLQHDVALSALKRTIGCVRREDFGPMWSLANNDCVEEAGRLADNSVDLIVTSIPFSNHYEYTPSYNDFGHTDNDDHFFAQLDFLTPQLLRALAPGRIAAIHVKDRIMFGSVTGDGVPTVNPFHAKCIFHYMRHGFQYLGLHHIDTDVVRENNGNYRLSYTEMLKDATKMGCGSPEYVLIMRKPQSDRSRGYADTPVVKTVEEYSLARWQVDAHAHWRSRGDRLISPEDLAAVRDDLGSNIDRFAEMPVGRLVKAFREGSRSLVYDYAAHIEIGEKIEARAGNDERGHLPRTFMALAPGSVRADIWDDVVRMRTLNAEQTRKGAEKHVCLARGSRVLTRERGYVPIEDVQVGEHALTHLGRWRPVEVVACTGVRPVITVRAHGVPCLTVTPDHKLWTRKTGWARERDGAERAIPTWIEAQSTLGGYLNLKLPPVEAGEIPGNDLTWWIVGRWLADGHFGVRGDAHISCGSHEVDALRAKLGDHAGKPRDTGTAIQLRLRTRGTPLLDILSDCGSGAAGKHLPPVAFVLDEARAAQLLAGYLSGDGHFRIDRGRWMASSVSRDLLLGVALLVQRVNGAIASVYAGRPERETEIEGRAVACKQEWRLAFDVAGVRRKEPFILEDGAWKKVRSLEDAGEAETWCLRVAEDASFTAEGSIVKNCPLQFDIVDRLIEFYSAKGDLVFDPFAGLGTVPLRAIELGRRGGGAELNPLYFDFACRYLRDAEAKMSVPTLFDLLGLEAAA